MSLHTVRGCRPSVALPCLFVLATRPEKAVGDELRHARPEARGERIYEDTRESLAQQADCCDRYVHENPWTSIGIGAAAGLVVGMLLGRR